MNRSRVPEGFVCGVQFTVPVIHMGQYLPYLRSAVSKIRETQIEVRHITVLADELSAADRIINCSGLGAETLVNDDDVYPCRGQVVVIDPIKVDGLTFITQGTYEDRPLYIVPRGTVDVLLGGTTEDEQRDTVPHANTTKKILDTCTTFEPSIRTTTRIDPHVGLRPARRNGPRVEIDHSNSRIIHNYGHGGAGVTLSWGCALRVCELVEER